MPPATPAQFSAYVQRARGNDFEALLVRFFDGHFALETHAAEIAGTIREFLSR